MIRKAKIQDVEAIYGLLKVHADRGELLPRALSDIYSDLRDYNLYQETAEGPLVGVCALHVCWADLAEIRSLAVREAYQRRGIGSALVAEALLEAQHLGITRVFTLTYRSDFFAKHGFAVVDKATLPQKVWAECIKCVKFPACDETALVRLIR